MTNFIPIFPLEIVVFPGEQLNLHIYEPRYKQMIHECYYEKKTFGIPAVIDNQLCDYGSVVNVDKISSVYENGEMDIQTRGMQLFRILEVIKDIPDKLYSGAIVHYPENDLRGDKQRMRYLLTEMRKLHAHLQVSKTFNKSDDALNTYDIAHHSGLTITEEYELLLLFSEAQRQEYLRRHFKKLLPGVEALESLKNKIRMNGHFKNLKGFPL